MGSEMEQKGYRESLERMEEIIRSMDRMDVDIDALAPLVEEAAALLAHCRTLLAATSLRVETALDRLNGDDSEEAE